MGKSRVVIFLAVSLCVGITFFSRHLFGMYHTGGSYLAYPVYTHTH